MKLGQVQGMVSVLLGFRQKLPNLLFLVPASSRKALVPPSRKAKAVSCSRGLHTIKLWSQLTSNNFKPAYEGGGGRPTQLFCNSPLCVFFNQISKK